MARMEKSSSATTTENLALITAKVEAAADAIDQKGLKKFNEKGKVHVTITRSLRHTKKMLVSVINLHQIIMKT